MIGRIVLRIGINLGDVILEGVTPTGTASTSRAGGKGSLTQAILVSGTAYDNVKNKISAGFEDLGVYTLKNIHETVRVYWITGTPRASIAVSNVPSDKPQLPCCPSTT